MTSSPDVASPDAALRAQLRARGQRVTSQRLVIHRVLHELGRHVSAEQVRDAVRDRLPGVSLPTVYATLDLFDRMGVVRQVSAGAGPALYDPRVESHHHLVCDVCGAVEDIDAPLDLGAADRAARRQGFQPARSQLLIGGLCARCA